MNMAAGLCAGVFLSLLCVFFGACLCVFLAHLKASVTHRLREAVQVGKS